MTGMSDHKKNSRWEKDEKKENTGGPKTQQILSSADVANSGISCGSLTEKKASKKPTNQ